jgi:glycosyltransferase involved in cell wall biosynthesis
LLPKTTILIRTVAGREELLRQAISSVLSQTVDAWDIVIVEDGSSGAATIIACFADNVRNKIRLYGNIGQGRCDAGNTALQHATGDYCCFLDDDDRLYPNHLECLVPLLQQNPHAVAAVARADIDYVDKNKVLYHRVAPPLPANPSLLRQRNQMPIQAVVFRRTTALAIGGLDASLDHFEDWDFWLRLLTQGEFLWQDVITSCYRLPANARAAHRRALAAAHYLPILTKKAESYVFHDGSKGLLPISKKRALYERLMRLYPLLALRMRLLY